MSRSIVCALCLLGIVGGTAQADEEYKRLTLTVNSLYLLVPVYEVSAELALRPNWSIAVRGGGGETDYFDVERDIMELGAQGVYYATGNANRGVQVGLDARVVSYEGDGMLSGLGDGVSVGPFIGYKRVFGPGVALGAQLGAEVRLWGTSDGAVIPHVLLSAGFSLWDAGDAPAEDATELEAKAPAEQRNPLEYHRGFMFGISLGGGTAMTEDCGQCELEPGLAVDTSLGWFLSPRWALMYDSTGLVGLLSNDFGSAGFVLESLAVQYWPHEDVWLKAGVGAAHMISVSVTQGEVERNGGGGTFAVGYEFHHDGSFNMDAQLRATHGSFDLKSGGEIGMDSFVGLIGVNWY